VKYLFDANVYVALLTERGLLEQRAPLLRRLLPATYLSSVVHFELLRGAHGEMGRARVTRATRALERTGRVIAPTHEDWAVSGTVQSRIWDDHPSQRARDLQNDLLIVSGARRIGALVVTENRRDFELIRRYLPHAARSLDELTSDLAV
jgi:predicted nucleic acid-binding protein